MIREGQKVLFLDLDGVLSDPEPAQATAHERLVPGRVRRLSDLVDRVGCRVVVSSTWRRNPRTYRGLTADQLEEVLRERGYTGRVHDITPMHEEAHFDDEIARIRGDEILEWCRAQNTPPSAIVVLDDVALRGPLAAYVVRTDAYRGLTDEDVQRAIDLFKYPPRGRAPWLSSELRGVSV
jgi:hypothetical protein